MIDLVFSSNSNKHPKIGRRFWKTDVLDAFVLNHLFMYQYFLNRSDRLGNFRYCSEQERIYSPQNYG